MSIFLSNDIIAFLFAELIVIALMGISQFYIVSILRFWDFDSSSPLQYSLEKKNYLVNTILFFSAFCKIILFIFFVLSLDELASIVPGAMCSAGVIGSNAYGNFLLLFKILLIFSLGFWLVLNRLDLNAINFPFLRRKYFIFSVIFALVLLEFLLEILYFLNIPLKVPVFCCSVVFNAPKLPFGYTQNALAMIFYVLFVAILVLNFTKQSLASFGLNLIFLFVAYYAITYFFGLYIYEQPNHKCPYCMLSKDYFYVGYAIWGTLFLGIFYGIVPFLIELATKQTYTHLLKFSSIFLSLCVLLCSFFVARYYILYGVFL
ncbi:MAG: hypothetical protein K5978_07325 [Campylobacter sp.]|nr:hypothetical protein [Campylobacter sp.]